MSDDVIRITDLAEPELNDLQKAGLEFGDSLDLDLTVATRPRRSASPKPSLPRAATTPTRPRSCSKPTNSY